MTTHLSGIAGDRSPLATCTGCESLDALRKEMFQAPGLLELERTLERHPHYPLLKLKEKMARRPAFMLGSGGVSLKDSASFHHPDLVADFPKGSGRHGRPIDSADSRSGQLEGREAGWGSNAAPAQTGSLAGDAWQCSRPSSEPRAKAPKNRRRSRTIGGRGVKKDYTYWLDRWEKDVGHEVMQEGYLPTEFGGQMRERVYSLASVPAAKEINERYRQYNGGRNVVSASSLRRRHPSTTTTNARGETITVKGAYRCERWGQWEIHRKGHEPEDRLAEGSTKMEWAGEDGDEPNQHLQRGVTTPGNAQCAAKGEDDKRKRSVADRGLQTATRRDLAEEAVATGGLTKHEGGCGITRVRPPADEEERQDDQDERAATKFLRDAGVDPNDVPWRPVVGAERQ